MRKTYKCSNVKFCMEDENQRRTWEHLQRMTRKDGSYGKALSDAFAASLDGEKGSGEGGAEKCLAFLLEKQGAGQLAGLFEGILDEKFQVMQEALAARMEKVFRECVVSLSAGMDRPLGNESGVPAENVLEPKPSEDMMAFAFSMGES